MQTILQKKSPQLSVTAGGKNKSNLLGNSLDVNFITDRGCGLLENSRITISVSEHIILHVMLCLD